MKNLLYLKGTEIFCALLLCTGQGSSGLDLNAARRSLHTTPTIVPTRNTAYFDAPLDPQFMPLCGNGRLDTRHNYETYYNPGMDFNHIFKVPETILLGDTGDASKRVGVKIFVDEVCDDGNRLDGDGCSADCLSRDKLDSACEIVVNWASPATYEAIAFLSPTFRDRTDPIVAVTGGIYRLTLTDINPWALTPFLLSEKSFPVSNMIIFKTQIYMYSASMKTAFSMSVYGGTSTMRALCSMNIGATNEPGFFYHTSDILYLVVKDNMNILLWKFENETCTSDPASFFSQTPLQPISMYFQDVNRPTCVTAMLQGETITAQTSAVDLCPGIPSHHTFSTSIPLDISTKPWIQSLSYAFAPVQKGTYQGAYARVAFINSTSHEVPQYSSDFSSLMAQVFIHSPFYIVQMFPGIRAKFFPAFGANDNTIFIGNSMIYTAMKSPDYTCGAEPCAMDFPTTYNIISQNPNGPVAPSDVTFDTVLDTLFSTSGAASLADYANVNATLARFPTELAKHGYPPPTSSKKQIVTHPTTGSEWIIDGSKLVEVSKRGASYELSKGKCIPATLGMCPPCHMYQPIGPCIPCETAAFTSSLLDFFQLGGTRILTSSLEWRLQCEGCPITAGRRRMLTTKLLTVSFVVSGSNTTELYSLFPHAEITNTTAGALQVHIQTPSPAATISAISIAANTRPHWKMDVQPRTVYTLTAAPTTQAPTTTNDTTNDTIPVWVWGVVGGLLMLAVIIIALCYLYRGNTTTTTTKYTSVKQ